MRQIAHAVRWLALAALLLPLHPALAESVDSGVIRLRQVPGAQEEPSPDITETEDAFNSPRRGFDYEAFEARLESLWFQRKTLLADGRESDAAGQSELIRSFCAEEGIGRVDRLAGALIAEAKRYLGEGRYDRAMDSLELAESFDSGRPQTHLARATVYWKSGGGIVAAARELLAALRSSLVRSLQDLSLVNRLALVLVVAVAGMVLIFAVLVLIRYQVPLRHEVEEQIVQIADDRLARSAGWAVLFLPMVLWFGTGWTALYWIVITFRFMRRAERVTAVALLAATIVLVPAYRIAVTVYGLTADPVVRTTLASANGEYDPNRILKLQELVRAYPEDPKYRFLLAGMYKNGRFFEASFSEYREAIKLDPTLEEAYINIGNIFHITGQHPEALAYYRRALSVNPRSILAYFNMHITQSESFQFKEAEESLNQARAIDAKRLAAMLSMASARTDGTAVIDANMKMASVWEAALAGGQPLRMVEASRPAGVSWIRGQLFNPVSLVALLALGGCVFTLALSRGEGPARRCIRCGRPFCKYCRSGGNGHEYCSQCLHMYVLGDGLAPETKMRKLYEVERYQRSVRIARRIASVVLPGTAQLAKGRAVRGSLMLVAWLAALICWQPVLIRPLERLAGMSLRLDLLSPDSVPAYYSLNPIGFLALLMMILIWVAGNLWGRSRKEA